MSTVHASSDGKYVGMDTKLADDYRRGDQVKAENERLRASLAEAVAMLKRLKWIGNSDGDCECVICHQYGAWDAESHKPNCELDALLRRLSPT